MFYLGLDISITNTGFALFKDQEVVKTGSVSSVSTNTHDTERFATSAILLMDILGSLGVKSGNLFCLVEDYAMRASGQITRMAENAGIFKYLLYDEFDAIANVCSVQTLKKYAAGYKAGKGKGPVMVGAYKKWGFETNSDDIADAYVLGKMAQELHYWVEHKEVHQSLLKYEQECIETVRKRNKYTKK